MEKDAITNFVRFEYGKRDTIYQRVRRWSKSGVLAKVFIALQKEQLIKIRIERISLDSTSIKAHPDAHGAAKKTESNVSERVPEGGTHTERSSVLLHVGTVNDRVPVEFSLSGGEAADCVEGRKLILKMGPVSTHINLNMDKAYSDDKTRELARLLGYTPVTPPKSNRVEPWEYDKEEYKNREFVERFFRRYKEYRRICTRYDKLDIMFLNYFIFALIVEMIK